jgi:hypothetical protein
MSYGMNNSSSSGMKEKIPSGYKKATIQNFTPEMMDLFQQLFSHLGPDSFLSKIAGGDQSAFAEMEAPALRQFQELQGGMASRFSQGGGAGGGQRALSSRGSSGFQNTMNQATSDFAQQLQGQRLGLRNQALKDLMSMSGELLNKKPFETSLVEKEPSFLDKWLAMAERTMGAARKASAAGGV